MSFFMVESLFSVTPWESPSVESMRGSIEEVLVFMKSWREILSVLGSMSSLYPTPNCFLICSGLSRASSWPFVIIQILSASSSASSRCYELMMIDLPTFILLISSHTCLLDSISRPEVGSSKMITLGLVTIAMAKDSFLFIPPERCTTLFCACSVSITTSKVLVIVCCIKSFGMSFNSQTK